MKYSLTFLVIALCMLAPACGKKGPLIYPEQMRTDAVSGISALQTGENVTVSFSVPVRNQTGKQPDEQVSGYAVYRASSRTKLQNNCTAVSSGQYDVYRFIVPSAGITSDGSHRFFVDSTAETGKWHAYSVALLDSKGVEGNRSAETALFKIKSPEPPVLSATPSFTEIVIGITPPAARPSSDNAETPLSYGYRIFRRESSLPEGEETQIGELQEHERQFVDGNAAPGIRYVYRAQTVVKIHQGRDVAGAASLPAAAAIAE